MQHPTQTPLFQNVIMSPPAQQPSTETLGYFSFSRRPGLPRCFSRTRPRPPRCFGSRRPKQHGCFRENLDHLGVLSAEDTAEDLDHPVFQQQTSQTTHVFWQKTQSTQVFRQLKTRTTWVPPDRLEVLAAEDPHWHWGLTTHSQCPN